MDRGNGIQNPYAGVNIPRAQLKSSFVRNTIGEDLDGVVIANPTAVPSYPSYTTSLDQVSTLSPTATTWEGNKVHTQDSWRRPFNPYASDKPQNGGHPNSMYTIDLDKQRPREPAKSGEKSGCCCSPCCSCCGPCCCCCGKPCCVIS